MKTIVLLWIRDRLREPSRHRPRPVLRQGGPPPVRGAGVREENPENAAPGNPVGLAPRR